MMRPSNCSGRTTSTGPQAASPRVIREILPTVRDNGWFFDSELVVRTERAGLPVVEIPVSWREEPEAGRKSKVPVNRLAIEYLSRVWQLRRELRGHDAGATKP